MPNSSLITNIIHYRLVIGAILVFGLLDILARIFLPSELLICNLGIGWSIPVPPKTAIIVGILALLVIGYLLFHETDTFKKIGWTLLFLGGSINVGDRILVGCVHDYFQLGLFPSFNGADMMLTLGVGVLAWSLLLRQA